MLIITARFLLLKLMVTVLLTVEGTPLNHSLFWKFQETDKTTVTPTELEDGNVEFNKTYHDDHEMGKSGLDNVTSQTEPNDTVMSASERNETVTNGNRQGNETETSTDVQSTPWTSLNETETSTDVQSTPWTSLNETETSTDVQSTPWTSLNENDAVFTSHSNETDKNNEHSVTFHHDQEEKKEITTTEVVLEKETETVTYGSEKKSHLTSSKVPYKTSTTQPSKTNRHAMSSVQTWSVEAYGNHRNSDVTKKNSDSKPVYTPLWLNNKHNLPDKPHGDVVI
ncbi:uncharacterized protein LOC111086585 isoform X2 [Limulus polyphemus]|uniref:Uncharacterized protein LOC111086585 isoform X2 n=1 Tax=Limulus polyphemus TaxID=6850 RepID=A0ABM1SPW5_LIMPO|nr:uncharacterized protein LOC111086585 isoform X2 [Limulus polyphemus]